MIELDRDEPVSYPEPISYITSHKTEKEKEKVESKSKPKPKPKVEPVHEVSEVKVIEESKQKTSLNLDKHLSDSTKIIWCINSRTLETKKPREDGTCYHAWAWWQNIALPPRSHLQYWRKYWEDRQIVNRFPIVNFESSFNENASNPFAIGYVQTLRKYWIPKDIDSQLSWMKNREDWNVLKEWVYGKSGKRSPRCWSYREQRNHKDWYNSWELAVLACMYRHHYHAHDGGWYSKKAMKARQYYFEYLHNNA